MKRVFLSLTCLGIFFTGLSSPRASETEIEVAGYEGSSHGGWLCGSQAKVRYGGVGGKIRHSERAAAPGQGMGTTIVAGAAVEVARAKVDPVVGLEAREQVGDFANLFGAGNVRLGYHFQYFGLETGLMLWSGWQDPRVLGVGVLPELQLSFGPRDFLYGEIGFGIPTVTWLNRPAVPYATVGVVPADWLRLEFHAGAFRSGPGIFEDQSFLLDSSWYVPIQGRWDLRGSLAFGTELDERQASLGFVYRL